MTPDTSIQTATPREMVGWITRGIDGECTSTPIYADELAYMQSPLAPRPQTYFGRTLE